MVHKILTVSGALILGAAVSGRAQDVMKGEMTKFTVRIENIATKDGMKAKDGTKWSFAMSPGLCIVHTSNAPVFSVGKKDRGKGLESQAEEGNPAMLAESLKDDKGVKSVTVFNTPIGTDT